VRPGTHHGIDSLGMVVRHEAEAAGPASGAIHHYDGVDDAAEQPEHLLEVGTLRTGRQTTDEDLVAALFGGRRGPNARVSARVALLLLLLSATTGLGDTLTLALALTLALVHRLVAIQQSSVALGVACVLLV
jgi:hypothetical protein